ncbi:MAG: ribosome small subunit-dependent GTPase A [Thermoleophilia bacterium]
MTVGEVRAALAPLGWDEHREGEMRALGAGLVPGRVVRVDRGGGVVATPEGTTPVTGAGLAAGDWVAVRDGRVAAVLTRRTAIARRAAGRADAEQVMAANVDVVIAVQALDRPLRVRRLHRALAIGWDAGARPVVALTKADLGVPDETAAEVAGLGIDAVAVSARTGAGIEDVAAMARPARTLVLLGESGAGKSTLTNALLGGEVLATGAVREGDGKGRHTTTARHLVALPGGGALIDTPGVRELGLWADERGVAATFADVADLAPSCRFPDCRHETEPGCAVLEAVAAGALPEERLASYRDLMREAAAMERRADERSQRAHGRTGSRMAREAQRAKRGRGRRR